MKKSNGFFSVVVDNSITVISITGRIVVTNFKNGKEARKEFYKYKRKKGWIYSYTY